MTGYAAIILDKSDCEVLCVWVVKTRTEALQKVYDYVDEHWVDDEDGEFPADLNPTTEQMVDTIATYFNNGHGDDWTVEEVELP